MNSEKWKNYPTLSDMEKRYLIEYPDEIDSYIEVLFDEYMQDKDYKALLSSLKVVIDLKGGMTKLAKETGLTREHLYRIFSEKGNPRFSSLTLIFEALGYTFQIKPDNFKKSA